MRVAHNNPNMWWFILFAANFGTVILFLLLLTSPIGGSVTPGVVIGVALWAGTNAVLIPIAVIQMREQLVLDFDRGTITTGGVVHPATQFSSAIETIHFYPGQAHLLTLVYAGGTIEVQVDGFTRTTQSRARNEALLAFVHRWLPLPDQYRSPLESGPMRTTQLIGKQELAELLRRG